MSRRYGNEKYEKEGGKEMKIQIESVNKKILSSFLEKHLIVIWLVWGYWWRMLGDGPRDRSSERGR